MRHLRYGVGLIAFVVASCAKATTEAHPIAVAEFPYPEYVIALPRGFILADTGGIDSIVREWRGGDTRLFADFGERGTVGGWPIEPHDDWADVSIVKSQIQGRPVQIATYRKEGRFGFDVVWDQLGPKRIEGTSMHAGFFIRGTTATAAARDTVLGALRSVRVR